MSSPQPEPVIDRNILTTLPYLNTPPVPTESVLNDSYMSQSTPSPVYPTEPQFESYDRGADARLREVVNTNDFQTKQIGELQDFEYKQTRHYENQYKDIVNKIKKNEDSRVAWQNKWEQNHNPRAPPSNAPDAHAAPAPPLAPAEPAAPLQLAPAAPSPPVTSARDVDFDKTSTENNIRRRVKKVAPTSGVRAHLGTYIGYFNQQRNGWEDAIIMLCTMCLVTAIGIVVGKTI